MGDLTAMVRSIPLALTVFRICSAPVLILLAALELERAFLGLAVAALLSDALDGAIARRLGAASQTGRLLDSWADLLIALSAFVGAALLWPDTMRQEATYIAVVLTAFVVPNSYALLRFRRLLGYHTISAKVSGVLLSTGAVLLFLGVTPLLFRVAALVELMVALEYIAISLIIPDWDGEIPSVWHALRLRNAGQEEGRIPRDA
ncbi:MAG TPA: CDP-alcohol phosphatidyltransferase family protein [Gemmatimonadaceae bacterium]|nr:CDP-alcohol phosphatidyltransferase family protein [Gemmatimonadaceae bacterium]